MMVEVLHKASEGEKAKSWQKCVLITTKNGQVVESRSSLSQSCRIICHRDVHAVLGHLRRTSGYAARPAALSSPNCADGGQHHLAPQLC